MKLFAGTLWLSALALLCGCAGGGAGKAIPGGGTPGSTPPALNIEGNWRFSTTSTVSQIPPATISGSLNQSGNSVSGSVHVYGSNCFDQLTTVDLTGTLTGSNISLTSTSVGGQVTTFIGSFTKPGFTGTYAVNGGCANGDQGTVTGTNIPPITGDFSGTFTPSVREAFDVAAHVSQGIASSEGSFGLTGTFTFGTSCFGSGTITSGMFPSASFIMGTTVALEIKTDNGLVAFLGTANTSTQITGNYTVSGGTCDQTGTAVLVAPDPWGY